MGKIVIFNLKVMWVLYSECKGCILVELVFILVKSLCVTFCNNNGENIFLNMRDNNFRQGGCHMIIILCCFEINTSK